MPQTVSAEQRLFRSSTEQFLARTVPVTDSRAREQRGSGFDWSWWQQGAELGWTGLLVPDELGGGSLSEHGLLDLAQLAEAMGDVVAPGPLAVSNAVTESLACASNAAAFKDVIADLVAGRAVASWASYEPGRPWQPDAPQATLDRTPSGWCLNGIKDRVDSGDQATHLLVTARDGERLVQVLVRGGHPGVTARADGSLDSVRRFATLTFTGVELDDAALVGDPHTTPAAIERQWRTAVVLQCAETVGVADRGFLMTTQWASDRFSFGRPLESYQALKHRFADMLADLLACRATAAAAAQAVAVGDPRASELVSIAKSWVGAHATDILQDCVQLHGGIALTSEHSLHLYLRRATVNRVMWGTPSEHRRRVADLVCAPHPSRSEAV